MRTERSVARPRVPQEHPAVVLARLTGSAPCEQIQLRMACRALESCLPLCDSNIAAIAHPMVPKLPP